MKVVLEPPFDQAWFSHAPFSAAYSIKGEVYRALEGRRTLRFEHQGRGYFVKIHSGVGWLEIIKNLFSLRLPVVSAENEWRAIGRLHEIGLDTMTAVAYGRRGINPARMSSFLITEELAPVIDLETLTRGWSEAPPDPFLRRALIRRLAKFLRIMHEGGVNHRDCYLCHFLIQAPLEHRGRSSRVYVIDLHRAQLRKRTPGRWRIKDLAGLYFSAQHIGLSEREKLTFIRLYYGRPLREVLHTRVSELVAIERKAQLTLRHHLKHHAH